MLLAPSATGEMAEWLKAAASKAVVRSCRTGGSNPPLSATSRVSTKKWGLFYVWLLLSTLSDDAQAVVVKVFEAICTALNEFHFTVEAFGNTIASGEAPHA